MRWKRASFVLVLAGVIGGFGFLAWGLVETERMIADLQATGLTILRTGPMMDMRQNWRAALSRQTWGTKSEFVVIGDFNRLVRHQELIKRCRPTRVLVTQESIYFISEHAGASDFGLQDLKRQFAPLKVQAHIESCWGTWDVDSLNSTF